MSLFSESLRDGFSLVADAASEPVSYHHHGRPPVPMRGVPAQSAGEATPAKSVAVITTRTADWLFSTNEFDGFRPAIGDKIVAPGGRVFAVVAPNATPPWRYSDTTQAFIRVHCVEEG
ncbi:MAG: hypothetical protein AAFP69_01090 [Planctomycetota bacterium]